MSVICANSWGWVLDARAKIDEDVKRCFCLKDGFKETKYFKCGFKNEFFDILKPRIQLDVDSKKDDFGKESKMESTGVDLQRRKKRKRKHRDLNIGEVEANIYHDKIRSVVIHGSQALLDAGRQCGFFIEESIISQKPSSSPIPPECHLAALSDLAKELPLSHDSSASVHTLCRGDQDAALDLFSSITENPFDCACEVTFMKDKYLLPARSRFLLSDITRMHPLVNSGEKYDLIVLDPPWENKSVKRSNRYNWLASSQLKQLPVPLLAAPGCLVVSWVTNRAKHRQFIKEELYPLWGIEVMAEWFWVKVTRSGEFVFPLDSQHKKPYEVLILGKLNSCREVEESSSAVNTLPDQKLLLSVPSTLHSHKPSLSAVLKPYIPEHPRCLELFARSLQADWSCWGNEVIKLQHCQYFTRETQ